MRLAPLAPALLVLLPPAAGWVRVASAAGQLPGPGPDLLLSEINETFFWGAQSGVSALSIGMLVCNLGDAEASWLSGTPDHPVFAQNLYRLHDGAFEQIGMSWAKHAIAATNEDACGPCAPSGTSAALGVGCSDVYSAFMNGTQVFLGPRSEIDAFTGQFPFPFGGGGASGVLPRRLLAWNADLDPAMNPGALYFAEAHVLSADDARSGNGENNVSHRRVEIVPAGGGFALQLASDPTVSTLPALVAWQATDPQVQITTARVPGEGVFVLGSRVTDLGNGSWRYEYALYNLNSHRAARAFAVPLPAGVSLSNIEFRAPAYHSGEPYSAAPWSSLQLAGRQIWATQSFAQDPNANALRWGTLYNFRFDAAAPPAARQAEVALFRPGTPLKITLASQGPS